MDGHSIPNTRQLFLKHKTSIWTILKWYISKVTFISANIKNITGKTTSLIVCKDHLVVVQTNKHLWDRIKSE